MRNPIRFLIALLAGLALAPLPLAGQQTTGPRDVVRFDADSDGPVHFLLRKRVELGLSEAQVGQLREIDQQMEERNRPYVTRLVQIRRELPGGRARDRELTAEEREERRAQLRAAVPLLERIRENNMQCMRQIGGILTADQKLKVRELIAAKESDERRDGRRRPDDRRN